MSDNDIMDWASGENIILDEAELNNDDGDNQTEEIINIKHVIDSLTVSLEWIELNNCSLNEILLIQHIREKAVLQKYDFAVKNM